MPASVQFNIVEHPYRRAEPLRWDNEVWGRFVLTIGDTVLVDQQWDLAEFLEWFEGSRQSLIFEELVVSDVRPKPGESLHAALKRAKDLLDDPLERDDEAQVTRLVEALEAYAQHHIISRGFEGTNVRGWVVGPNRGTGEISNEAQVFQVDLKDFERSATAGGIRFLETWLEKEQPSSGVERATDLLAKLRQAEDLTVPLQPVPPGSSPVRADDSPNEQT
jgi:hypothetical protein